MGALAAAIMAVSAHAATSQALSAEKSEKLKRLQDAYDKAARRGQTALVADALYDLAKAQFEAGQSEAAESNMRRAAEMESGLKRADARLRTVVALAMILASRRKNSDSLEAYRTALALAEGNNMDDAVASVSNSMGALALVTGRLDEAQACFSRARAAAEKSGNSKSLRNALLSLAAVERARARYDEGLALIDTARKTLAGDPDDRALAAILIEMGTNRADAGDLDQALGRFQEAVAAAAKTGDAYLSARALNLLGQGLLKKGDFRQARETFARSEQELAGSGATPARIDALTGRASASTLLGDYKSADEAIAQALALAEGTGDGARRRAALSERGYSYLCRGEPERALSSCLEAIKLVETDTSPKVRGVLLADLAMTYKALGQFDAAIDYYSQSVSEFERAGDAKARAAALNSLSVAYLDGGRVDDFDKTSARAKAIYAELNDRRGQALVAYNLAQQHLLTGHFADAVPLYEEALDSLRACGDRPGESQVWRSLGLAYIYLGRAGKSLECYERARAIRDGGTGIEAEWECALGMGKAYKVLGRIDESLSELRAAADLVERERLQLSRDSFKTFNMDLRQDCFMELVDVLVKAGKVDEALAVAEKGRARAFLDMLEGRRSLRPNDRAQAGSELPAPAPIVSVAVSEPGARSLSVLRKPGSPVEPTVLSPINALPPSLDEIKDLVRNQDSTFLEYFALPDKLLVWVVKPGGQIELASPVLISRRKLDALVAACLKSITTQPKSPADAQALSLERERHLRELNQVLIEPVLPLIPSGGRLTIVPHGPLFLTPFAALIDESGKFLVEKHTISYVPAIGVLRATQKLRAECAREPERLLAFGNPIIKQISFLGALPFSEKEVQRIAELFGRGRAVVETGARASKANFRAMAGKFSVIHLATHGLIDEERPMDSALVLAPEGGDDGLLTVRDILQMPALKAKLVTLSACQTGRGKITGDGVVGLSRAFIIAGTPSVVVSQWNVDDVMTEFEMGEFYKSYLSVKDKATALREAQLKTIEFMEKVLPASNSGQRAPRPNPRYWAAFQLVGETRQ